MFSLENLDALDKKIFFIIHNYRNDFLDLVLPLFSEISLLVLFILLFLFILKKKYTNKQVLFIALTVVLALICANTICDIVKYLADRARPYEQLNGVFFLQNGVFTQTVNAFKLDGNSFYSGHTTNTAVAIFVLIFYLKSPKAYLLAFVPVIVAWSRIYLGKHFFADVLVGYIMGFCVAYLVYKAMQIVFKKIK